NYNLNSFFFQAEDGIRDFHVTGVQTCALPILTAVRPETTRTSRPCAPTAGAEAPSSSTPRPKRFCAAWRETSSRAPMASQLWPRSEERRVGKEGRYRWSPHH